MAVIMSLCAAPSLAPRRFPMATKPSSQGVVRLSLPPRHLQGPGGRSKKTGLVKAVRDDASRDIHTDYYQVRHYKFSCFIRLFSLSRPSSKTKLPSQCVIEYVDL
jgi:hypothetical protein